MHNDEENLSVPLLLQKIQYLRKRFVDDTSTVISQFIFLDDSPILKNIDIQINEPKNGSFDLQAKLTHSYLNALYQVVVRLDFTELESMNNINLLKCLLVLHCTKETNIATLATKTLGVLIKRFERLDPLLVDIWWKVIEKSTSSEGNDIESINGYILWLRCINGDVMKESISTLQTIFDLESYWNLMITGLLSKSFETRKYTLHILTQSLQKIDHNINTHTMFWDTTQRKRHLLEWEKFVTLVNIVSIDTSIHQAGDSAADLVKLIGKNSLIPKSWARCLLSTGLKSSTDSIRCFTGNVTLSLTMEDMGIFLDGFDFLTKTLLPQLMLASHFSVQKESPDGEYHCTYGDKLTKFIEFIFEYLDDKIASDMCQALMDYLHKERYSFDPARLYIVHGIERGIRNRKILNGKNLQTLALLFNNFAESELRSRAFCFLYFRLLFSANEKIPANEWFQAVYQAISFQKNIYTEQFSSLVEFIQSRSSLLEFFSDKTKSLSSIISKSEKTNNNDPLIIYLDIHYSLNGQLSNQLQLDLEEQTPSFYIDLILFSGISSKYIKTTTKTKITQFITSTFDLIISRNETVNYDTISRLTEGWTKCSRQNSWLKIDLPSNYAKKVLENISKMEISENTFSEINIQLMAFNIAISQQYNQSQTIEVSTVLDLALKVVKAKVADRNYLPTKHTALFEIHKALNTLFDFSTLSAQQVEISLEILSTNFEFVNFQTRSQICESLCKILSKYHENIEANDLEQSLSSLWSSLAVDRLIATERSLHFLFLDFILDPITIEKTLGNESLAETVETILNEVIELSYARRCLLPYIGRKLLEYLVHSSNNALGLPDWIGRVETRVYTFNQIDDNLFKLESVIAQTLDQHDFWHKSNNTLKNQNSKTSSTYMDEYGCQEIDAKIYSAMFFAGLSASKTQKNRDHTEFAQKLYRYILSEEGPYRVIHPAKRNDGLEESERIRALQILLLLSRFFETDSEAAKNNYYELKPMLDTEPSPLARIHTEWLLAKFNVNLVLDLVSKNQGDISNSLVSDNNDILQSMNDYEGTPRVIASLERIALLTARGLKFRKASVAAQYYREYIHRLIPFSTSNRATVRHSAVAMLVALDNEFKMEMEHDIQQKIKGIININEEIIEVVGHICDNARASDSFKQYRSGENSVWDIDQDFNLVGICGGVLSKLSDRKIGIVTLTEFNSCSYSSLLIKNSKVNPLEEKEDYNTFELQVPAGFTLKYDTWKPNTEDESVINSATKGLIKSGQFNELAESSVPLQTKSGFWNAVINLSLGEDGRDSAKVERGELIVVASLVDKAPNLGGICRLSDVLGAKLLCLHDLSVSKNPQFKSVAVTADRWMPMAEVAQENIIEYMMRMKREEGYTLIGLEQTDKSIQLNADLKFPKKSLILLGKEREGIPGEFLAELDFCVEIKQVGVIRSMNIQTATAVIVHAYSTQHC